MSKRPASHSGQWYSSEAKVLESQLETWMGINPSKAYLDQTFVKAVIAPHAGYNYSGIVAAASYSTFKGVIPKLIVVLGPSHYKYLKNQCAISAFSSVQTPVGDIEIDIDIRERLVAASGEIFKISSRDDDLKEHSLEMQYPFIAKVFNGNNVRILPIQVGQFSDAMQRKYAAENLLKCIANIDSQDVMFVVSSDFCHYGPRFDYKPIFKESNLSLNENISILDHKALDTLNSSDPINAFTDYLKITGNTICGREPILFLHEIFNQSSIKGRWELIDYAQSNFLTSSSDNSVSYLSAIFKVSSQASGDAS